VRALRLSRIPRYPTTSEGSGVGRRGLGGGLPEEEAGLRANGGPPAILFGGGALGTEGSSADSKKNRGSDGITWGDRLGDQNYLLGRNLSWAMYGAHVTWPYGKTRDLNEKSSSDQRRGSSSRLRKEEEKRIK